MIDMCANRREISVTPANRVTKVTKQANGSMAVEFANGTCGMLDEGDAALQEFVIYSILASL